MRVKNFSQAAARYHAKLPPAASEKHAFHRGARQKIPQKLRRSVKRLLTRRRAKSPPSAWRKNPADRDTNALHHRRSKKFRLRAEGILPARCRKQTPFGGDARQKSLPAAFFKKNPFAGNRGGIHFFSSATCSCCDRRTGADQCRISSPCSSRCGSST